MSQELTIIQPQERAGQQLTTAPVMALPSKSEMAVMLRTAEILFEGGLLPESIKNHQAAFTIMLKGRELGISAMNAFASINVIKGKPTLSADLMVAILRRAGHKLWVVKSTDTECVMKGYRRDEPDRVVEIRFTYEDATRAGLTNPDRNGNPSTWMKYPAQLCYARCASRLARIIAPDELAGMYTPEELGATVQYSEDGAETVVLETPKPAAKPTLLRPEPDPVEDEQPQGEPWPEITEEQYIRGVEMITNGATPDEARAKMGYKNRTEFAAAIKAKYPNRPVQNPAQMLSAALQFVTDYFEADENF
jgi:hypothetical protein